MAQALHALALAFSALRSLRSLRFLWSYPPIPVL